MLVNDMNVADLWKLDLIGITDPSEKKTKLELQAEVQNHLVETVEINPDGRYGSRSRSRSYARYRSSGSRFRTHSYRSRSRSYDRYSRRRSRSDDYHRCSRSESDDRRRKHDYHMNKYQGRYPRKRGTYYRPRFQNFKNPRGNFQQRVGRNFHQKYQQGRGNRPFGNRGRGRGGRGRYFHYKPSSGYKDHHSRYEGNRPRSSGSDDRRSCSREDDDPMKKVDAAKEKFKKYIAEENKKDEAGPSSNKSRDEPLSEGEAVDDDDYGLPPLPSSGPPSRDSSYVDRKAYDGKWAEKESEDKNSRSETIVTKVGRVIKLPRKYLD